MHRVLLGCFAAAIWISSAAAESNGTLTLKVENDLFYKADREYTSGVGLGWTTPPNAAVWAKTIANELPFNPRDADVRVGYSLDQAQFTPLNISVANPGLTERPYAAWLFGTLEISAQADGTQGSPDRLGRYQLQLGVVGPWALGEQAQNFIHRLRGFPLAQGWHYQLHNEPGLVLRTEQSWRYVLSGRDEKFGLDFIPHAGVALGNVYDYVSGGFLARLGLLTRDFGPMRIDPSLPGTNVIDEGFGLYVFAGGEVRAVARNLFLDGNTFESSRSVSKYPFVVEGDIGATVSFDCFRVTYTHTFLSREYRTQSDNHQFGAISISASW